MVDEVASVAESIGEARVDVRRGGSLHNRGRDGRAEGSAPRINREINLLRSAAVDDAKWMSLIAWVIGSDY